MERPRNELKTEGVFESMCLNILLAGSVKGILERQWRRKKR